jgi:hypothetical protein
MPKIRVMPFDMLIKHPPYLGDILSPKRNVPLTLGAPPPVFLYDPSLYLVAALFG